MNNIPENNIAFSICIPIYNCNVYELVSTLHRQAVSTGYPFEILLIDDHSSLRHEDNLKLQNFPNISYTGLNENRGRSKIRNLMAEKAQYPYLIFMDCDTEIDNPDYLENYLKEIPLNVVVGGYQYSSAAPSKEYMLRWHYGVCREQRSAAQRNKQPNRSFSTFNFMIKREIWEKIRFNENISGYGHEDTLFGWELKQQGIAVKHIDNPILHKVLDDAGTFIKKTENSVHNLWKIYQDIPAKEEFAQDNSLLKLSVFLRKNHLSGVVSLFFNFFKRLMYRNLISKRPCLRIFDFYRLGVMALV